MAVYEEDLDEAIETVRGWISDARCIVVLTGAGISTVHEERPESVATSTERFSQCVASIG